MNFAIAASQARRLLAGAGDMSFVAYRQDSERAIDVLVHGLDEEGRLVIACNIDDVLHLGDSLGAEAVRVDILKKAPEFDADILAASLHALGTITWQEATHAMRFGVIDFDTVYLHGTSGPLAFSAESLRETSSMSALSELEAREIVAEHLEPLLPVLIDAALLGEFDSDIDRGPGNALYDGGHYVLDISELGLTLLRVTRDHRVATHILFDQPAFTSEDLATQCSVLAIHASARLAASLR